MESKLLRELKHNICLSSTTKRTASLATPIASAKVKEKYDRVLLTCLQPIDTDDVGVHPECSVNSSFAANARAHSNIDVTDSTKCASVTDAFRIFINEIVMCHFPGRIIYADLHMEVEISKLTIEAS